MKKYLPLLFRKIIWRKQFLLVVYCGIADKCRLKTQCKIFWKAYSCGFFTRDRVISTWWAERIRRSRSLITLMLQPACKIYFMHLLKVGILRVCVLQYTQFPTLNNTLKVQCRSSMLLLLDPRCILKDSIN